MKIIHIADIHASRERFPLVKKVFTTLINRVEENDIDYVLFAGDFWDCTITNTEASHFTDYMSLMNKLSKKTHVIMIYGTPSHEPAGSLNCFSFCNADVIQSYSPCIVNYKDILVIALPEPRLSLIKGNSLDEKYQEIKNEKENLLKELSQTERKNKHSICIFHGDVAGMKYQNGQIIPNSETAYTIDFLRSLNCEYYAGGHIHEPSLLEHGLNGGYSGSAYPLNFGETHDAGFIEVEL